MGTVRRWSSAVLVGMCLVLAATACGTATNPEAEADPTAADRDIADAQAALDAVNAELDGLDREARRERLIELAMEEGGLVSFYTSQAVDDMAPVLDSFEEDTGLEVEHYRAGGNTVVNRLLQEADAGYNGADVLQIDTGFIVPIERENLLLRLDTPIREDIPEFGQSENWLAPLFNGYIAMWNTDLVSEAEAPASWEDVFTNFKGDIAVDPSDVDWFMTLVSEYFVGEKGMSEEEAIEFITEGLEGAYAIRGHSVGAELHMAGQFAVHASQNVSRVPALTEDGAPFGWLPPPLPIVVRTSSTGIISTTERPASALLLTEYILTDGQEDFAEIGLLASSTRVNAQEWIDPSWATVPVDYAKLDAELEKWESLMEEVLREAGATQQ